MSGCRRNKTGSSCAQAASPADTLVRRENWKFPCEAPPDAAFGLIRATPPGADQTEAAMCSRSHRCAGTIQQSVAWVSAAHPGLFTRKFQASRVLGCSPSCRTAARSSSRALSSYRGAITPKSRCDLAAIDAPDHDAGAHARASPFHSQVHRQAARSPEAHWYCAPSAKAALRRDRC